MKEIEIEVERKDYVVALFIVLCIFSFIYFGGRILWSIAYKEGVHDTKKICFQEKMQLLKLYERGGKNGK